MAIPDLNVDSMRFTPNRQLKATPRRVVSAEGIACRTADSREVFDNTSGF